MDGSEMNQSETALMRDRISKCEDVEELKNKILPMIRTQQEQWSEKIVDIISGSGYTKTRFAQLCRVSRVSVDKWCKGALPKNRETYLRIGMAANYSIEQMNQLLQRYGRYPALYAKSLEDCICMFVIERQYGRETLEKYDYILKKIKDSIVRDPSEYAENVTTERFNKQLKQVKDEDGLEQFITDNIAMFSLAYYKFYSYVNMNITANYEGYADSVFELAEGQGWTSSLRQCVSAIRQKKWYPTRNKIISLGLHLSMDHDQIDEMLELAHMEPLCAKNVFESVIMFVLDDASLNNFLDSEAQDYDPDMLCRYAREVFLQLDLPELKSFVSEISEIDDEREE